MASQAAVNEVRASNGHDSIVRGRILDPDSHVMLPVEIYEDVLGPRFGRAMREWAEGFIGLLSPEELRRRRQDARANVWQVKAWEALGAEDAHERLEALDLMGVDRQLVFPPVTWPTLHADDEDGVETLRRYKRPRLGLG